MTKAQEDEVLPDSDAAARGPLAAISGKRRGPHTIRDIAAMVGVSRATVSLAMNGSPKVKPKTRELIMSVIKEVGYRPNQAARNLVHRKSGTLLVILPKIDHVFSDVYFSECLSGIVEVATNRDYHMMVQLATKAFRDQRKALTLFQQGAIDGVLCAGNLNTDDYLVELAESDCPVVLVNSSLPGVPQVLGDNVQGARRAVEHLYGLGHRRIGHIRGPESVTTALDRTNGYFEAMDALGLGRDPELVAEGYFDERSGYEATKWLISRKERPTAIFTTNDVMAVGALRALRDANLRVPEDMAIVGGDDIQLARLVHPTLTTIRQSMDHIGLVACEQLFRQMDGEPMRRVMQVELELVVRESCGALKAAGA